MDIFDASDYDFLLPRPLNKFIALSLIVGIAFVPPVKRWYIDQIERHAQHISQEFVSIVIPDDISQGPSASTRG
jgi:hypothetical protein